MFRKLMMKLGVGWITGRIRDAAEGRLGKAWQDRYLWWKGRKTATGFVLALVATFCVGMGYTEAGALLAIPAGVLLQTGLLDKAWNSVRPEWLTSSKLYLFLVNNAEYTTLLLGAVTAYLYGDRCTAEWCAQASIYLPGVAFVLAQMGLINAAWKAERPILPPKE